MSISVLMIRNAKGRDRSFLGKDPRFVRREDQNCGIRERTVLELRRMGEMLLFVEPTNTEARRTKRCAWPEIDSFSKITLPQTTILNDLVFDCSAVCIHRIPS
mmetsp:Transcript_8663/g.18350  ORF Transcript_8663/g.18350 Transcript_8663/m.18350 type:complete len:103 (+) Transcript_8663:337-645(+)